MTTASPDQPLEPRRRPQTLHPAAQLADGIVVLMLAVSLWVVLFGGIALRGGPLPIVIKSVRTQLLQALALVVVRHLFVRRPTIVEHLRSRAAAAGSWFARTMPVLAEVAPAVLVTRLGVLVLGYAAVTAIGYQSGGPPFRWSYDELLNLPARWDAGWYMAIALYGYDWNPAPLHQTNLVFFPAYPMTLRAVWLAALRPEPAVACWLGVAVSVVLFAAALVYVFRLAMRFGTTDEGRVAAVLLAAYPFAVFYSAPYTESFFLLMTAAACFYAGDRRYLAAALPAVLAGFTRPNGILLGVPLALLVLEHAWRSRSRSGLLQAVARAWPGLLCAGLPAVGIAAHSALTWYHTGKPLLWLEIQRIGWGRSSGDVALVWTHLDMVRKIGLVRFIGFSPYEAANLLAVGFVLATLWPLTRRLGIALGAFVAVNVLVPLMWGGLLSIGRFTAVLFPVFIWMALALPVRLRLPVTFAFAAGQALGSALFFTWRPFF